MRHKQFFRDLLRRGKLLHKLVRTCLSIYQSLALVDNEPLLPTFWNLARWWKADAKSEAKRPKKIADA